MSARFEGRRAVVTGGAQGIGRACVERLLDGGASVVIADISAERAEPAAEELSARGSVYFVQTDIAEEAAANECIRAAVSHLGGLDVLVNNASLAYDLDLGDSSTAYMRRIFDVNLFGALHMIAAASPVMAAQRYGRIVNVSSDSAFLGHPEPTDRPADDATFPGLIGPGWALTSYAWAKSGVLHLTKLCALSLGPWGITVNAVAPGVTMTEAARKQLPAERADQIALTAPLKRLSEPDDPAAVICFLASDDARMLTGQVLVPNGGGTMTA